MIASPLKYVRCNQVVPAIVRLRCRQREPRERNVKRVGEPVSLSPFYDSVGPGIPSVHPASGTQGRLFPFLTLYGILS